MKNFIKLNPIDELHLAFFPDFLDQQQADAFFKDLKSSIEWEQPIVKIFGKEHPVPRKVAFYGEPDVQYRYSGQTHTAIPWTESLQAIKSKIQESTPYEFNSVLLNFYRSGADKMGWHADDEKVLGSNPVIISLNLGAERRMDFRDKKDHQKKCSIQLPVGSLLIMLEDCQHRFHHQIPMQKRIKEERINLTFRQIKY
ncbi:alpha-ketoglutarate-dependent dioxygenase AlkB [Persicobacter psychrovividus]|uniref:Alpha-ketoglutarate-dependent dioxygenase AlkB n=1 Tax=Persicobacter psychrovividus TaxID=387638 RepID=A0ABM7VEH4_9BACT|nr:alpha-ketoglutarate-dependent dioxygenase AlkB [Persicobacter psychrovividus]